MTIEAKQMGQTFAISSGLLVVLLSSAASAADVLMAEMEDFRGETSLHQQTMPGENCDVLLAKLRELTAQNRRMQLTFVDPPFSGYVKKIYCVGSDGSIRKF